MVLLVYKRKGFIMATFATNTNIVHMNQKQLRKIATDVNVNPVTINATIGNQKNVKDALITAIKAK